MRQICSVVALLTLALVGCNSAVDDAKKDLKGLEGSWDLIYFERDGKEVKLQSDTTAINTGDKFVVKRGDQVVAAGTMKLDPSRKPKASDTTYTEGPDKGKTFKGIYQFDGDKVKFCRAGSPDDERPTAFKTKPGSGRFVAVYQRAQEDAVKKELKAMAGTWKAVSLETDGKKAPADILKIVVMTRDESGQTVIRRGDRVVLESTVKKLGPSKKPRTIDTEQTVGEHKGKIIQGIYELDGDTLRVCLAPPGKERPSEFSARAGSGNSLAVYKREKK